METKVHLDEISAVLNTSRHQAELFSRAIGNNAAAGLTPDRMRALLDRRGFRFPTKNIIFHCLKGGASKTTLAYNSAFRIAQLGARVLLVDLDKQANATQSFERRPERGVFVDAVTGRKPIEDLILEIHPHLSLVPSSLENARLETELIHRRKNPRTYYRNLFAPVRDRYDILVFDLPPDLSHNTYLSTILADTICIPINADEYSVAGMRMTLESIDSIRAEFEDLQPEILVIWSKFDSREKSCLKYVAALKELGSARLLPVVIRTDVTFKHAQAQAKSVFQLGRRSNAREDIDVLVRELTGLRSYFGEGREDPEPADRDNAQPEAE
jgi:chromosome partitioning protein